MQFVETMTGVRAVQAYRRELRNAEIFSDLATRYRDVNTTSFRLVGNVTIGVALLYGGLRALEGDLTIGVLTAFLLSACLPAVLPAAGAAGALVRA